MLFPKGRPKKHWSQRARVQIWYEQLRKLTGLNDNQLGVHFGWRPGQFEKRQSSDVRTKMFEWMRKRQTAPQGRDPRWRSMQELVDYVELESGYGLKEEYESKFWTIANQSAPKFSSIHSRINILLSEHGFVRVDKRWNKCLIEAIKQTSEESVFNAGLDLFSEAQPHKLVTIELIWLMYLEAKTVDAYDQTRLLSRYLDTLLDQYFNDRLESDLVGQHYYLEAVNGFRSASPILSRRDQQSYPRYARQCERPIWRESLLKLTL